MAYIDCMYEILSKTDADNLTAFASVMAVLISFLALRYTRKALILQARHLWLNDFSRNIAKYITLAENCLIREIDFQINFNSSRPPEKEEDCVAESTRIKMEMALLRKVIEITPNELSDEQKNQINKHIQELIDFLHNLEPETNTQGVLEKKVSVLKINMSNYKQFTKEMSELTTGFQDRVKKIIEEYSL